MIDLAVIKSAPMARYLDSIGHLYKEARNGNEITADCPVHRERTGSWHASFKDGIWQWKCFGCAAGGSILDLHAQRCGLAMPQSTHVVAEALARMLGLDPNSPPPPPRRRAPPPPERNVELPSGATPGTRAQWQAVADRRKIPLRAIAKASEIGMLWFANVKGFPSWLLTDDRRRAAEARRMDGEWYPAETNGPRARKAHCLPGSKKDWPVGLFIKARKPADSRMLMGVEGPPDFLAALEFSLRDGGDCMPFAFLGAGAVRNLHQDAIPLLAGRSVRLYPHNDENEAGQKAGEAWTTLLQDAGATVESFDLAAFCRDLNVTAKDLNDLLTLPPDSDLEEALGYLTAP